MTDTADPEFDRLVALGKDEAARFAAWLSGNDGTVLNEFSLRGLAHSFGLLVDRLEAEHAARVKAERERDERKGKWAEADEGEKVQKEFLAHADARLAAAGRDKARLVEALGPFVMAFEARRDSYSQRHSDRDLGYANFDKMPDDWPMKVILTMGNFRRARALLTELSKEPSNG